MAPGTKAEHAPDASQERWMRIGFRVCIAVLLLAGVIGAHLMLAVSGNLGGDEEVGGMQAGSQAFQLGKEGSGEHQYRHEASPAGLSLGHAYDIDRPERWYVHQEVLRLSAEAAAAKPVAADGANLDLLLLGDSITERLLGTSTGTMRQGFEDFVAVREDETKGLSTLVLANSGDYTHHLFTRLRDRGELPLGLVPRVVNVLIGTNDIGSFDTGVDSTADIARNVLQIVRLLRHALPRTHILLQEVFYRGDQGQAGLEYVKQVNRDVEGLVAAMDGKTRGYVRLVNCADMFASNNPNDGELVEPDLMFDRLHPSVEGMRPWLRDCVVKYARPYIQG